MMLPVVEDSKEVFETTPIAPEITIMEEYMQDLNKILLVDETKLYNEKPCKDSGSVLSFDVDKWKNEHPQKLLTHLGQLCNLDDSSRSNFLLAKLIEQIYKCRNSRLVLPLGFRENLVTYKLSNNALLSALNSSTKPCGSHTFLSTWLNKAAESEIKFPNGIVRVVFDNEQVIGKRYRVKADQALVPASVITSSAYLIIDDSNNMQFEDTYKPSDWMFKSVDESLIDSIIHSFESNNDIFRVTRNELLKERISDILKSQKGEGSELFDCIDVLVNRRQEAEHFKICLQCNSKAPVTLRTCKVCKGKLVRLEVSTKECQQEKVNPYSHFKAKKKSNAIKVMVGEPDMLNPNSFENLSVIL